MPQRHHITRFIRDYKEFTLKYVDFAHYSVNINTANRNGFEFPGAYIG